MALDTTLNVKLNSRDAEQQISRLTSKNYGIKLSVDSQPLGRTTGQLSEFTKSMDAANARVVAFGASAGAIAVLEKSFRAMITSTIEVEKSLKDIQVVLDASGESMAKFGKGLFDIAKNTGQSFSIAAEAATELSRQGLSMEETLKRTNDALVLSRLSGLGAAESVKTLTAAINSFASQGVTASEVVNKFATVDAAFAVSSKDLAEGISRVGASAAQSGVSIDELIGLITSAQQVTARGGAVIGNSFKTIFTRLERGKTQSLLESLGIDTKDESGKIKSTIEMLRDLAKVYGSLGSGQQAEVAEKVGGVFQINILKAALADLGREHSVYAGAVDISNNATDEATKRNEKLNETYAAQINRLQQGASQLAAAAGKRVLGPSMDRVIGAGNGILDNLNNVDSSSIGAKLGKGLLDGIGQVIAGPGLVLLGGVIIKLLGDFSKFAGGSVKELLGLNGASKEQAAIQASITKLLEKNPALLAQINSEAKTQGDQARILLDFYMKQTAEMQKQAALTAQIAGKLYTGGVRMGSEGVPITKKAAGYIPEFASEEAQAKMLGAHNPRAEWSKGTIGGQRFIKNSEETEIVGFGSNGDSAVIPHYAKGYIPNFTEKRAAKRRSAQKQAELETKAKNKELKKQSGEPIDLGDQDRIGLIYSTRGATLHRERGSFLTRDGQEYIASIWAAGPQLPLAVKKDEGDISKVIDSALRGATNAYIKTLGGSSGLPIHEMKEGDKFANSGAISAAIGTAFETAITRLTDEGMREGGETARIDFSKPSAKLRNLFDGIGSEQLEAKYSNNPNLVKSTLIKAYDEGLLSGTKTRKAASGYIPNFADRIGIVTGDVIRGNEYKEVIQYLANTTKPVSTILGPAGVGKTTRAASMGGQLLRSFAEINKFDKFILDRAGFDVPQKDTVTAENIKKIFAKSNAAGSLDVLFGSRNTVSSLRERRLQEGDQIIGERNNLKGGSSGVGSFTRGIRGFLGEYENANVLRMRKSGDQYGLSKVNFASGYVPNFADALHESIAREISAGAPANEIYVKKYSQLASENNPDGYGVFNRRDEGSMSKEMTAMRNRGYAKGYIPNFAEGDTGGESGVASLGAVGFANMAMTLAMLKTSSGEATKKLQESVELEKTIYKEKVSAIQLAIEASRKDLDVYKGLAAAGENASSEIKKTAQNISYLSMELQALKSSTGPSLRQTISAKGRDFVAGGGLTNAAIFAPLIAGQIAEMIPKSTPTQRGAASTVTGIGNIASMTGTGFMLGGAWGAAVGGAIAAINEIPKIAVAFTSKVPELQSAAGRAADDLNKFNAASQEFLNAYDRYNTELQSGTSSERNLKKAREAYITALDKFSSQDTQDITRARETGGAEGVQKALAEKQAQKVQDKANTDANLAVGKIAETQKSNSITRNAVMAASWAFQKYNEITGQKEDAEEWRMGRMGVGEALGFGGLKEGGAEVKQISELFNSRMLKGKTGKEAIDVLSRIDIKEFTGTDRTAEGLESVMRKQLGKASGGEIDVSTEQFIEQVTNAAKSAGDAGPIFNELAQGIVKARQEAIRKTAAIERDATVTKTAADQTANSTNQIQKWIIALQKTNALAQSDFKFGQESKQKTLEYNTKSASQDRTNQFEISEMIAGKSRTSIAAEYKNKVKDIEGEGMVKQSDVIKDFLIKAAESANTEFNTAYNKESRASSDGNNLIINALTEKTQRNFPYEGINLQKGDMLQARLAATGEQNRGSQLQREISNDTRVQSALKSGDIENLKGALVEHLVKLASINQEQGNTLEQTRADAEVQANELANKLIDIKTATERQKQDTAKGAIQSLTIEGLKSTMASFGGYKGFMDKTGGGVADVGSALSGAVLEEKSRKNIDSLVKNNLMRGVIDNTGNVVRDVKFDKNGNEVNYRQQVAGNGDLGRNYLKLNEALKSTLGTSAGGGDMSGYVGTRNAENIAIQERTNDLDRSMNELMKQAGYFDKTPNSKGPTDAQKMIRERLSEYINNASGGQAKDLSGLGADEMRKALNVANKTKATIETSQAFNDFSLADKISPNIRKTLGGEAEAKRQEKALSDYFQGNGNKAEQEAAQSLRDIYGILNGGKSAASSSGQYGLMRPDEERMTPTAPSQSYLLPDGKGGLYKPVGSYDTEQKNKQQSPVASSNTINVPVDLNININAGSGSRGGYAGAERDQADQLQRNVNSLLPELKASIENVVKQTFERRINSLEGRMDRVAMTNQAAKPVPLGIDPGSTVG